MIYVGAVSPKSTIDVAQIIGLKPWDPSNDWMP